MTMKTHSNTDWKELAEHYQVEIEGWHLFYQSFIEYENVLSVSKGVLIEMYSEIAKAVRKGNTRTENAKKRADILFDAILKMEGLNNRCMMLQQKLKKTVAKNLDLEKEIETLKSELEGVKKAHEQA